MYKSFFSALKWHLSRIDQGIQILQLKKDQKNPIVFFIIFWMFSSISKKAHSCKVPPPFSMCCITHVIIANSNHVYSFVTVLDQFCMVTTLKKNLTNRPCLSQRGWGQTQGANKHFWGVLPNTNNLIWSISLVTFYWGEVHKSSDIKYRVSCKHSKWYQ